MKLKADSTFGTIIMVLLFLGLTILLNSCGKQAEYNYVEREIKTYGDGYIEGLNEAGEKVAKAKKKFQELFKKPFKELKKKLTFLRDIDAITLEEYEEIIEIVKEIKKKAKKEICVD